ncbi:MAG: TIM barrel protein, partial [Lentisphaerae bacterium]|nr:TIM barrel protein [Lentisphaerota bacterium]
AVDLSGVALYTDPAELFARERLDAVSITVPTHLHADVSVRALEAGAHVLCEKPMALSCAEGRRMLDAAASAGRHLQIGHCIRFWPEYVKAREIVTDGAYGRVISATFRRFSATARTRRGCWFGDASQSGGMLFDLHSHDTDFVQHLFGLPQSVCSHGDLESGGANHIVTAYRYAGGPLVTAEGGWAMTPSHGFQMVFTLVMEGAVVCFDSKKTPTLTVYPESGEPFSPPIAAGDGYEHQIRHFIGLIRGDRMPAVISPHNALTTLRLLEAERESMAEGQAIEIKEEIIGRKCQQETTVCGWPLSVCSWSLRCDPDGVARALSELDIRLVNLALKPVFAENGAEYLAAVRRLAWPLSAATIGFFHEDYTSLESIRTTGGIVPDAHWPRSREMVLRAIDLTVELGAPFLTLHAGFIEEEDGTAAQRVRDRLTLLADAAGEHGIGLLLETGQESAGSLRHLLETLRHPALGINFDPANMILYGKGNPVQAIGTLAPWIRHIHVKDALTARQPGQWGTEVPWGDGEVGQQDFLQALHKVGYRGALAIEREAGDDRQRDIGIAIKRLRRE